MMEKNPFKKSVHGKPTCKKCGCEVWQSGDGNWHHCFLLQHDNGGCPKNCKFPLGIVPKNMVK